MLITILALLCSQRLLDILMGLIKVNSGLYVIS